MQKNYKKMLHYIVVMIFKIFYMIKITLYRIIIGRFAPADVLKESFRPEIILELYGAKVGNNVRITRFLTLHGMKKDFSNLIIGNDVHIGRNALIDLHGQVTIGDRVTIGMFSRIYTHQDIADSDLNEFYPPSQGDVIIPDDTVIGTSAILVYPFSFPKGTFVGAGSVVRGHYPKQCLLIGNPARPIPLPHNYKSDDRQEKLEGILNTKEPNTGADWKHKDRKDDKK
jgi:acetyltransferase-like isoleucine patch superfamily enzyme